MATDLTFYLNDEPGELARLGAALGKAGVNIDGLCAMTSGGGKAEIHVLVADLEPALDGLQAARFKVVSEQEVAVLDVEDRPGVLGEVARKLGEADVNINLAYLATNTRLVLGAEDLGAVKAALG